MTMRNEQELKKAEELRQALSFLANNWCHNHQLREAFEAIFQKLNSGTKRDKANAEILREYLSYPGSPSAQSSVDSLRASLREPDGRNVAGMGRKGRSRVKKNDPALVKMEDKVMQFMIAYLMKRVKKWEIDAAIYDHLGEDADPKTIRKFRKPIETRAQAFVDFYDSFQRAFASNKPFWEELNSSEKTENNR
jgi:hypothetical protein